MTDIEKLAALVRENRPGLDRHILYCALDVAGDLSALYRKPDLQQLELTYVVNIIHWPAGKWRLVRHDHCDVIGGKDPEEARIVTHKNCTVLGEEPPRTRRDLILATAGDCARSFSDYDRRDDEELSAQDLADAIEAGEVTLDEIAAAFRAGLEGR